MTRNVRLSFLMDRAHELAGRMEGDYMARIAEGLRLAWMEDKGEDLTHDEVAEELAEQIEESGEADDVRVWTVDSRSRVYVSRELSRGRKQQMGYVEIMDNGEVNYYAERRRSIFHGWSQDAERIAERIVA